MSEMHIWLRKTVNWYLDNLDWCKKINDQANYKGERMGLAFS